MKPELAGRVGRWRERARKDIFFLGSRILGYDLMEHHYPVQVELAKQAEYVGDSISLIPRSWTKSTVITVCGSVKLLLNHPDWCILIASAVLSNSMAFLSEITSHFYEEGGNDIFRRLFPEFCPRNAAEEGTQEHFRIPNQPPGRKEHTFETAGMDARITSRHYERILADDIVNRENVVPQVTPETMAKTLEYFQSLPALLNQVNPQRHITIVGTRWNDGDAYGHMLEDKGYAHFRKLVIRPYNEEGESNWPEVFSKKALEALRGQMGEYMWACLMEQDPLPPDTAVRFHPEWIRSAPLDEHGNISIPEDGSCAITIDPAFSKNWRADRTAMALTSVPPEGGLYVLSARAGRWSPHQVALKALAMYDAWVVRGAAPEWIGVEVDGGGHAVYHELRRVCEEQNRSISVHRLRSKGHSKESRAAVLQAYTEAHGIFLGPGLDWVKDEVIRYPVGKHDDALDMLSLRAVRLNQPERKRKALVPSYRLGSERVTGEEVLKHFGISRPKRSIFSLR